MNEFCKDCGGKCCYTFRVLATDAEFKTMVRYLNENNSLSDAICAALAANVKDLNGIKVITEVGERCPFLKEGKCLVYEARPEACEVMFCDLERREKISVAFHELRRQEKLERIVAQSGMGPKSFKTVETGRLKILDLDFSKLEDRVASLPPGPQRDSFLRKLEKPVDARHFRDQYEGTWEPVGDDRVHREHKVPEELAFPYGEAPVTKSSNFPCAVLKKIEDETKE